MNLLGGSGGGFTGSTDWGGLIGGIGNSIAGIYQAKAQTSQLNAMRKLLNRQTPAVYQTSFAGGVPAASGGLGMSLGPAASTVLGGLGGLLGGALGLGPDVLPGGLEESGTGLFGLDLFRPTESSARQRMLDAVHPGTGERVYWRPVGRPIMFAGDRALLLKTRKVLRKMNGPAGCGPAGRRAVRRRRR
jgi:hypothetical protein